MDESAISAPGEESAAPTHSAELIIPPARRSWIPRAALGCGFILLGLAVTLLGLTGVWLGVTEVADVMRHGRDANLGDVALFLGGGVFFAGVGVFVALLFVIVLVQEVQVLRSTGLRLTTDGYELNGRMRAWNDVEGFQLVGQAYGTTHILVRYAGGAHLSRGEELSAALGVVGYFAPAYIARGRYNTGGQPLERILRQWWRGDGDVAVPG